MKYNEFNKLKKLWYNKLKQSGFTDIEYYNSDTYFDSSVARTSYRQAQTFSDDKLHFFLQITNYLTHTSIATTTQYNIIKNYLTGHSLDRILLYSGRGFNFKHGSGRPTEQYVVDTIFKYLNNEIVYATSREYKMLLYYNDGNSYRFVMRQLKHVPKSIFYVHRVINTLLLDVQHFNNHHSEGLNCYIDPLRPKQGIDLS